MITDAQIHLWEADRPDRPWAAGGQPPLPEPMTAERMLALMDGAGVARAVISPLMLPEWTPDYALEVASRYPSRFKVMGWYWTEQQASHGALSRWLDDPRMCSMRIKLNQPELAQWLADGRLEPFWSEAERHAIPVAFWLERNDATLMVPVAQRHPRLTLIVDHLNWPVDPATRERKIAELEVLAAQPNVYVKVSSLPRFSSQPYPYPDVHPMIQRVHAAFGARRLMWGADQSQIFANGLCGYREHVDIMRVDAARYLSADDLDRILHRTASEVFRWEAS